VVLSQVARRRARAIHPNRLGMAGRMESFRSRRSVVRREITLRAGSAASWLLPLPCYEVWQARPFHLA